MIVCNICTFIDKVELQLYVGRYNCNVSRYACIRTGECRYTCIATLSDVNVISIILI